MAVVMLWREPPCPGVLLEIFDYGKRNTAVEGGTASEPPGKKEKYIEDVLQEHLLINLFKEMSTENTKMIIILKIIKFINNVVLCNDSKNKTDINKLLKEIYLSSIPQHVL